MARTFTEAEAQRVFARVAERQRASRPAEAGLSLADLEEAARAAGLDPTLVAGAVAEIDTPAPRRGLLGAPTEIVTQRLVRGPVSDEAWEAVVGAARGEFGHTGVAGQVGRVREWTFSGGGRRHNTTTRLSLEPVGTDTRVVLTESVRDVAVGFTIAGAVQGAMAIVFGLVGLLADPALWIPAAILACMSVMFLGGSQVGLRLWHQRRSRRIEALLDRLDLVARDAAPADPAEALGASVPAPAGRIDAGLLDGETDAAADDEATPTSRRTRA